MNSLSQPILQLSWQCLQNLRAHNPRIHALTNAVAQTLTPNVLLALRTIPSTTYTAEEIRVFVNSANTLLINLGTLDQERLTSIPQAVDVAIHAQKPWVLDPVFVERSPLRLQLAHRLLEKKPSVLRCNASEFNALTGDAISEHAVLAFARKHQLTVALTGEHDLVSNGEQVIRLSKGHPFMAMVTALGCSVSAMIAACLAVEQNPYNATLAALTLAGIAGENAAQNAKGPGSFAVLFLDALYQLNEHDFKSNT